jgi:TM2 domain-containing membrane protein YozV
MVSDQWYTTSAGQVYGPYSAEDIRAWLRTGQMSWDTQASRGGDDPWRPLSAIAEFNPAPAYGAPVGAVAVPGKKDKTVAGILGILLGWAGAHHWYLGNYLQAALYLVFFWTGIPSVLGLVEGIIYLTAPEDRFQRNYNKWFLAGP